jgi:hypothetical protein
MTQFRLDRYELPYNYDIAAQYSFKEIISFQDKTFWVMSKIRYNQDFLYFHKKTNLVFDDRMNLLGRYINDQIIVVEDLSNKDRIETWLRECKNKPLSIRKIYEEDLSEKIFEIV